MTRLLAPLHARPLLYWLLILLYIVVWQSWWLATYQPTNGRLLTPFEIGYVIIGLILLLVLLFVGWTSDSARAAGAFLAKSRLTGVLITFSTIIVIFLIGEWSLRLFYITTDGYGFTAMNYWWYQNYGLAQDNSLGYRDYEPMPDSSNLIRIAIVGDSFAMGHGINNLDNTFPQLLERTLGEGYDVNLIADSGRDADLHLPFLEQYTLTPDILIYSYYLNDIDYLLHDERDPDSNFDFIQNEQLHWFVQTFFLPNYLYYNLLQFTSQQRTSGFANSLFSGYENDAIWQEHQFRLNQMVDWVEERDIPMIVLLWPHLTAIDVSQNAVTRVRQLYEARGVPVVDMTPVLRQYDPSLLIVNRFDTHPSIFAHQLAAVALEPAVRATIAELAHR
jgi:hypothetical protein